MLEEYTNYHKVAKKLMSLGKGNFLETYIKRIEYPVMGYFYFKRGSARRYVEKKVDRGFNRNEAIKAARELKKKGWYHIRWTLEEGHIFYNQNTGKFYPLKRDVIVGTMSAYLYFAKICRTDYVDYNIPVFLGENIVDVTVRCGSVYVYNKRGVLVNEFETIADAYDSIYLNNRYLLQVLLYNSDNPHDPRFIRGNYWFLDNERHKFRDFKHTTAIIRYSEVFDLLDAKTGEVVIERIGTASDLVEFFRSEGKCTPCKTGYIFRQYRNGDPMYGYKIRKSFIQLSKW